MTGIISKFRALPFFCCLSGVSEEQITCAEDILALRFADDYREYLRAFGVASGNGHEFTGICNSKRLNVVDVTLAERDNAVDIPQDWYVLEEADIDGIIIWQCSTGEVFQMQPNGEAVGIAASICEYLEL